MTLNFTKSLLVCFFFAVGLSINAQTWNRLQVTSPASIAGEYAVNPANFGDMSGDVIIGDLLLIDDGAEENSNGCEPAINDLTGFIALIDRGACAFVDKANNAQNAGAIAMVVCNNLPGDGTFGMGGDDPNITIPCVMASYEDCQTIRAELGSGVSVEIDYFEAPCIVDCASKTYPASTVWGQNGEGAFGCGLGDWTVLAISDEVSTWRWDADGTPVGQTGAPRQVDSETVCNGAAIMDFADHTFGPNPNPTQPYPVHHSDLLSPLIDLTGYANPVIHFDHYLNTLSEGQEIAFLTYSRDGGSTWLDTIPFTGSFINAGGESPEFLSEQVTFPFCGDEIGNTAEFRLKFIGNGNFYFWIIDDIYITDEAIADAEAFEGWFSGAANFRTPASQVDRVPLMVDANNNGNIGFDQASYTATISKDGTELFSQTQDLGVLPRCENVENVVAGFWDMSAELGRYDIQYTLDATGPTAETDPENNTVGSSFEVTDKWFGKVLPDAEAETPYLTGLGQNATYITYGNAYYTPNGAGYQPTNLRFGFDTDIYTDFGFTTLVGQVREWTLDANGDGIANLATETTVIAEGTILLDPGNQIDLRDITMPVAAVPGVSIEMKDNTQYIAMVHVSPLTAPAEDTFMAPLSSGFLNDYAGNKDYFHAPADFAFGQETGTGRPGTMSDFEGSSGTPDDLNARNLDPADASALSWFMAMEICEIGVDCILNTVDVNNNINVSVYPNPAANTVQLDMNLTEVSSQVTAQVVDLEGRVIATQAFNNVKNQTLNLDLSAVSNGVYLVNIFTDAGVTAKRIVVQK